jgi:hypothetical protein
LEVEAVDAEGVELAGEEKIEEEVAVEAGGWGEHVVPGVVDLELGVGVEALDGGEGEGAAGGKGDGGEEEGGALHGGGVRAGMAGFTNSSRAET